jgi:hypothetical protein
MVEFFIDRASDVTLTTGFEVDQRRNTPHHSCEIVIEKITFGFVCLKMIFDMVQDIRDGNTLRPVVFTIFIEA